MDLPLIRAAAKLLSRRNLTPTASYLRLSRKEKKKEKEERERQRTRVGFSWHCYPARGNSGANAPSRRRDAREL